MNDIKLTSNKNKKKNDWKSIFDMRLFRYSFLKQLNSISTYLFFCLVIVASGLYLWLSTSATHPSEAKKLKPVDIDSIKKEAKIIVFHFKNLLYTLFIIFFTIFIALKSLQIFRDEMDDGTLLIFSSMPYSRKKLIIQKWFSLQAICLIFVLSVLIFSPIIFLLIEGFSQLSIEVEKIFLKSTLSIVTTAIIFQVIFSTLAIIISLYFGKVGTIAFLGLFSAISIFLSHIPLILRASILTSNSDLLYIKTVGLGIISEQNNLFSYYKDADLKELFEYENWFKDSRLDNDNKMHNNNEIYDYGIKLNFEDTVLSELYKIIEEKDSNNKQDFLAKNIKVKTISADANAPKYIHTIINLLNKANSTATSIEFCPVKVEFHRKHESDKIVKTNDKYKTALDNIANLTKEEKMIINLSKSLWANNRDGEKFINYSQIKQNNEILIANLKDEYNKKYHSNTNSSSNEKEFAFLNTNNSGESIVYFPDNLVFQNLSFLLCSVEQIISNMYLYDSRSKEFDNDEVHLEKYFKIIKANNYLNIISQLNLIWSGQGKSEIAVPNYYGKWEKKEKTIKQQDGTQMKKKYLKLKPESLKRIINPVALYIVYSILSIVLASLLIWIISKKDFV